MNHEQKQKYKEAIKKADLIIKDSKKLYSSIIAIFPELAGSVAGQEQTQEDEEMILAVLQLINDSEKENGRNCVYIGDKEIYFSRISDWFKSLKFQNKWKPKEEQIECLSDAIKRYGSWGYSAFELRELLDDLKKLINYEKFK